MPNFQSAFKAEITRLVRRELRVETESLKKAVTTQRSEIAALKRRIAEIEKGQKAVSKVAARQHRGPASSSGKNDATVAHRFRAEGMANNRKRLSLSAEDFALLVGTTGQSIYAWESGRSKPRPKFLEAIAGLRTIGKKEAALRLESLKKGT